MTAPENLKYTKDHEWAKIEGANARIGITAYAQGELGDIVFVDLMAPGAKLRKGDPFGTVESVKAVSDVYAPVGGTILEINPALESEPELVNHDCYAKGWMIVLSMDDSAELEELMDANTYAAYVEEEAK